MFNCDFRVRKVMRVSGIGMLRLRCRELLYVYVCMYACEWVILEFINTRAITEPLIRSSD